MLPDNVKQPVQQQILIYTLKTGMDPALLYFLKKTTLDVRFHLAKGLLSDRKLVTGVSSQYFWMHQTVFTVTKNKRAPINDPIVGYKNKMTF